MVHSEAVDDCCNVQGEIQLPVVFENPSDSNLPSCIDIFRPVRQSVYAILYGVTVDGELTWHRLLAVAKLSVHFWLCLSDQHSMLQFFNKICIIFSHNAILFTCNDLTVFPFTLIFTWSLFTSKDFIFMIPELWLLAAAHKHSISWYLRNSGGGNFKVFTHNGSEIWHGWVINQRLTSPKVHAIGLGVGLWAPKFKILPKFWNINATQEHIPSAIFTRFSSFVDRFVDGYVLKFGWIRFRGFAVMGFKFRGMCFTTIFTAPLWPIYASDVNIF